MAELFKPSERHWRDIAEEAYRESNSERLANLIDELIRSLDERDKHIRGHISAV